MKLDLSSVPTKDLLREVERRAHEADRAAPYCPCYCGIYRKEIVQKQAGFEDRRGCLNCNRWDNPPVLLEKR